MITKVRAKMTVQTIEKSTYSETAKFQCVYGGSSNAEDNSFARATPNGSMQLGIDNEAVHGFFRPGKNYYVDITEVPDPVQPK